MYTNTDDISNSISNSKTIKDLKKIGDELNDVAVPSPLEYLLTIAEENGFSKKEYTREIIKQSPLERSYVYHLLSGEKKLTRDKLIMLAIIGKFNLKQLNNLLKFAGVATIYPKNKRDMVLQYIFEKQLSLYDANICLLELGAEELK